ncbi:MAG TPA: NADH-quinone oxidoreductase subunit M [Haliscomenobacter sp.]|uniref:complex I subunit 4 family protein n=1 Tax=Haliscomenobacter sp. TaxID=2717303 RepID=UPI002B7458CC|nr:NADH-quinone oxidoreductase subunit M [Haliscomenobacter sp.]HOY16981.1 NADH-quinone oxidoreductase subunit M [Haliscomenobacter sp.]HPH21553.1 NADH-quinone oxidoreductase subunit M [Haliscomenobacter sp.]
MLTTFLLFLPIIGGFILTLFPGSKATRWQALFISAVAAALSVYMAWSFVPTGGTQFEMNLAWLPSLGIGYHVGADGISMVLLLLTNLLSPLILLSTFKQKNESEGLYYGLMLMMQGAMTGVFVALDLFLYYIFWELALIPAYFLVLLWGSGQHRRTALKFFIYTLLGSLLMLVAIIFLSQQWSPASFDISNVHSVSLSPEAETFVLLAFMLAYAIKIPLFPFHTWQPDTYTQAPTAGTMLLSGVMLKMGLYSIIRWVLPVAPNALMEHRTWMIWLIVIGIAYASIIAIQQKDLKRLFAYSSIAHVGLIAAGILTMSTEGLMGSMLQMVAHGINAVGLFYICAILMERTQTNEIAALGGIRNIAPWFATTYFVVLLGSVALPLTNGFPGEFMLLSSLFQLNWGWSLVAGSGVILGAVYMFKSYQGVMLGEIKVSSFRDLDNWDKAILIPIVIAIVLMGILPNVITRIAQPSIEQLLQSL